jgi:death-on-curing protein
MARGFYSSPLEKAASLGESLIINHPFLDGNKRTAFLALWALLKEYGIELEVANDDLYHFIISMSTGESKYEDIVAWLNSKINRTPQ